MSSPTYGQPSDNRTSDFEGISVPNRVGYRFLDLDPGSNVYVQRDDILVVQFMSRIANESVTIGLRQLIPGRDVGPTQPDPASIDNRLGDSPYGSVLPLNRTFISTGAYVINTQQITLSEGYLLSVAVSCTLTRSRGNTFVKVYIARAGTSVAQSTYALFADYVTNQAPTGWPFGRIVAPVEGNGNVYTIQVANPAAGIDWVFTPNTNTRVRISSVQAQIVTSAAVANRGIAFKVRDQILGLDAGTFPSNAVVVASTTAQVTGAPGAVVGAAVALDLMIALPGLPILANNTTALQTLNSVTALIQAADQWSNIAVMVEEWLDF